MEIAHHSTTVLSYAQSLLDLANGGNEAEAIGTEMGQLRQIVEENPTFAAYLADPGISHEHRSRTLRDVFAGKVLPLVWKFLGVLNLKGRLKLLPQIAAAYGDLLDAQNGKIEVDVTVAKKLPAKQLEDVQRRIGAALKKDAIVHQYEDESIIGGMILRVQDQLIDASVRNQLDLIRKKMLAARPR